MFHIYSEIPLSYKNNEILPFATTLLDLESIRIILSSEMSDEKGQKAFDFTHMSNIKQKLT